MLKRASFVCFFFSALALAACGGGGSGGTVPGGSQGGGGLGTAVFTISDPYSTQAGNKHRNYFSSATASLQVTIGAQSTILPLTPESPQCTIANASISCSASVSAPDGPASFTVAALDDTGHALSQVSGSTTISGNTTIPLALQGVWHSVVVRLQNENPPMGSPVVIPLTISAYDDDDRLIVGPEPYSSPIPLFDSDTSGATSLSATSVTAPGVPQVTLSFNGTSFVSASISGGVPPGQALGGQDTLVPALQIAEYAIPSGATTYEAAGLNGRIFANGSALTFAERTTANAAAIGSVTTSGTVTEMAAPSFFDDIVLGLDGNVWGVGFSCYPNCTGQDNNALKQFTGAGAGFTSPMFPEYATGRLTVGSDGNFWLPTAGSAGVLRVTPAGVATYFAAPYGTEEVAGGVLAGDGNMWFVGAQASQVNQFIRVTPAGVVTGFPLPAADVPTGNATIPNIAAAPDGSMYVLLGTNTSGTVLGHMTTAGVFSTTTIPFVGITSIGGEATSNALAFGPDGALWIAIPGPPSSCQPAIERVTTSGAYATLLLPISCNALNGPAPTVDAFAIGPDGNLWYTRGTNVGKIVL